MANPTQQHTGEDHVVFDYNNVFFSLFSDNERFCSHRCSEFGLNYVLSGEMMLDDGTQQLHVAKGQCVFVPRDHTLTMYKQPCGGERYQGIFVTFNREFLRQMFDVVGAGKVPASTPRVDAGAIMLPSTPELQSLFASLLPYFGSDTAPSPDIMRLKQQEALLALLHIDPRFAPTLFDFSEPWKIDILDFMNQNYMHELTMHDMAHYTGRSLAAFKRDFKKVSDTTPERWLTRKRLEKAYELIVQGGHKMADVCHSVGFKNTSHFSTAFKRQYGITPAVAGQRNNI